MSHEDPMAGKGSALICRDDAPTAAFFDVDGTLARTTIVHYYIYFQRRRMSPLVGRLWYAAYLIKCGYFLVLDRFSRSRLNIAFYRSYRGLRVDDVKSKVQDCYADVIVPRQFPEGATCVAEHLQTGRDVVFVTGCVDFIIRPLAESLGVTHVVAPTLLESEGRFTGELDGPPVGDEEKARRVLRYAHERGIDLSRSYAYGDSISDLPMLDAVGYPQAVNPDHALAATAAHRGWPVHWWQTASTNGRPA